MKSGESPCINVFLSLDDGRNTDSKTKDKTRVGTNGENSGGFAGNPIFVKTQAESRPLWQIKGVTGFLKAE